MKDSVMKSSDQPRWFGVDQQDGILSLALNNPPWNVLTTEMLEELNALLETGSTDDRVRAVLIFGEGRGFCAGSSVQEHLPGKVEEMLPRFRQVITRLGSFPVPTIAALHGVALGGGLELACAADIVFAAEDTKIGQPEIGLGAMAPAALVFLPQRIGYHRAADLLFSGRQITAGEARTMGLVEFVCSDAELLSEARKYARLIAAHSGPVLREYKRALLQASAHNDRRLQEMEELYLNEIVPQPDYLEGLKAFLEKRDPRWQQAGEGEN